MKKKSIFWTVPLLCIVSLGTVGQGTYNLATELENGRIKAVNRIITRYGDSSSAIEMNAAEGDGIAVLEAVEWNEGTIQVELLGENNPGRSFVGIAFNIQDDNTYEAVYFRPFNFVAEAQGNREHMVQYICHPDFTWYRLREERTGEFENEIQDPPDPDDWFSVLIRISDKEVSVFMENGEDPVLTVQRLTTTSSDKMGLWTGNGSSGRYRNLIIEGSK